MSDITRPVLRWHGGKFVLAPWILRHFPAHRIYVEPFGGAASLLLRKPRSYGEVYNDLDNEVVGLFRTLRDPVTAAELVRRLNLTPFARDEFELSYKPTKCPIEMARRLVVRSFMGFGSDGFNTNVRTGFRSTVKRSRTTPAHDWAGYPEALGAIIERLQGVVIENRDACEVMAAHDGPSTLHYVDPPYVWSTRSDKKRKTGERYHHYRHELTDDQHTELLAHLRSLHGMVVLSGYANPLYDNTLSDWHRIERETFADGANPRIEVLWTNPAIVRALGDGPLFLSTKPP